MVNILRACVLTGDGAGFTGITLADDRRGNAVFDEYDWVSDCDVATAESSVITGYM